MKSIVRRTFLKKTSKAGIVALLGAPAFPGLISAKKHKPICEVKKEVYVAYPKPGMAPITSMSYVGRGMKREEIRSFMQSSDWSESTQRRTSENNGRFWSDWMPVPKQTQTLGQFTQSGGESQNGSGPVLNYVLYYVL